MASPERVEAFLSERRNAVVAGVRKDGRPHLSPNWFLFVVEHSLTSPTRHRVKYRISSRDPRVELAIDDATGHRAVLVSGTVEIREDIAAELAHFRAIRERYGVNVPSDEEHLASLTADGRVMLVITPEGTAGTWSA